MQRAVRIPHYVSPHSHWPTRAPGRSRASHSENWGTVRVGGSVTEKATAMATEIHRVQSQPG